MEPRGRRRGTTVTGGLGIAAVALIVAAGGPIGTASERTASGVGPVGASTTGPGAPAPQEALTAAEWRADLEVLRSRLPAAHPDLFHLLPEDRFHRELDALSVLADTASQERMLVGLARVVAAVGEGHTSARILGLADRAFPVRTEVHDDGLRVVRAPEVHADLLGARVTAIEGRPVEAVLDSVATLVSADNRMGLRPWMPIYLVVRDVLSGLGLLDGEPGLTLDVETAGATGAPDGTRRVTLEAVPLGEAEAMLLGDGQGMAVAGADAPDLVRDAVSGPYGFRWMAAERALFVRIDRLVSQPERPFPTFVDSLFSEVERRRPERLILDVRSLSGGNHISLPLIHGLIRSGYDDRRLFVLIGRGTFSAGQNLVTLLERHADPVFVGEPTSSRPNMYGVLGRFTMPNSGLEIRHARYLIQASDPADYRHWQAPHLSAPPTYEARAAGRDPALEAVLAFDGRLPGAVALDAVEAAREDGGLDAALGAVRSRADGLRAGGWKVERELNRFGYDLLRAGEVDGALDVFRLVTELFPDAWNAWDSLGDGLATAGRVEEAVAAYERSLALNGYNDNARRELGLLALER